MFSALEESETRAENEETCAKQRLGTSKGTGSSLLGLPWNKLEDQISVIFPRNNAVRTKRGLLCNLATIYDPLGLVSPLTLKGKFIFRDVCISKVAWDAQLPEQIAKGWLRLEKILLQEITTPRCITGQQEQIEEMELHAFGDAGAKAKQGLTIPGLELVAAHGTNWRTK